MKLRLLLCLACLCAVTARPESEKEFGLRLRTASAALVQGLDPTQAVACLQAPDPALRWKIQYTGGVREGVKIGALPPRARDQVYVLIRSLLSEAGWKQAQAVAAQNGPAGLDNYYVAFFGDPRTGDFAVRIAEHHLTLIQLELADGEVKEFGPILLGCDPPALWQDEEQALLTLWSALGPAGPGLLHNGRAPASEAAPTNAGPTAARADLPPAARQALEAVWKGRLAFFSEPVRARIERLVAARGGLDALRMAFYNEPATRRCADGGRWDWKLAGDGLLLDFETSRKHIHMSLWIR